MVQYSRHGALCQALMIGKKHSRYCMPQQDLMKKGSCRGRPWLCHGALQHCPGAVAVLVVAVPPHPRGCTGLMFCLKPALSNPVFKSHSASPPDVLLWDGGPKIFDPPVCKQECKLEVTR